MGGGNIIKICKKRVVTAERISCNAHNGDIVLNASKSVNFSAKENLIYDSYSGQEEKETQQLLVKKVTGPEEVELGKTYTFKAVRFSREITDPKELENVKWAYQLDDEGIKDFPNPKGRVVGKTVVKKAIVGNNVWDNKTIRVYAYLQNPSDDVCVEVNVILKEAIIVVGTEQYYTNPANKLMFPAQAVREVKDDFSKYSGLKVLIFKDGYTENQVRAFSNAILSYNNTASVVYLESIEELINYINYGQKEGKKVNYEYRKVSTISVYAHGYVRNKTNEGVIAFGYGGTNANIQELDIKAFSKINKDVFLVNNQSHFYSYACRTGIGVSSEIVVSPMKENSLAQKMSDYGQIIVHAYMRRSLYEDTWGTQNHRDTYASDNDKGSSGWENLKIDVKDAIRIDPNDMKAFSKYISTEKIIDGAVWNPKGAYLPVKAGAYPKGVSSSYEKYRPNK